MEITKIETLKAIENGEAMPMAEKLFDIDYLNSLKIQLNKLTTEEREEIIKIYENQLTQIADSESKSIMKNIFIFLTTPAVGLAFLNEHLVDKWYSAETGQIILPVSLLIAKASIIIAMLPLIHTSKQEQLSSIKELRNS